MADEEIGIALVVIGIVLIVLGLFIPFICLGGIVLLIIGIVLMATRQQRPAYAMPYAYPPPMAYAPPVAGVPTAPAAPAAAAQPLCSVCGTPLSWVPQYGRWYCSRCMAYR